MACELSAIALNFRANGRILIEQTNLSARYAVGLPAGGERSGLTAHFFFGRNLGSWAQVEGVPRQVKSLIINKNVIPEWNCRNWAQSQNMAVKLDEMRAAADRVAGSLGLEVVELEFTTQGKSRVLAVYLEKDGAGRALKLAELADGTLEEGAVPERYATGELNPAQLSWLTHEDCAEFSRDFGTLLDVENIGPESEYLLEVSSPGLDRQLTSPGDFDRFQGLLVKIRTFEPIANNRNWQGRLVTVAADVLTLDLTATRQNSKSRKAGVSTVEIARTNIELARLVPEF